MEPTCPATTRPGPLWMWITAWSLQGGGVLLADLIAGGPGLRRLVVTGLLAAVPLGTLYLLLLKMGRRGAAC